MITNCQEHTDCILEYAVDKTEEFKFDPEYERLESMKSCNNKYIIGENTQIEANTEKTDLGEGWRPCRATECL